MDEPTPTTQAQYVHSITTAQPPAAVFTDAQGDDTYILGDIDVFLVALEQGIMQAQWEKDQAKAATWIRDGHLSHGPDASED